MRIEEIAEKIGCAECTTRMYLGRYEFSSLRIYKGNVENIEEKHIERLKEIFEKRAKGERNASYTINSRYRKM